MLSKWANVCGKLLCGAGLALCARGVAEGQSSVPVSAIATELQVLGGHAASLFVGQITSIEHQGSVVEVRFRIEQTIRGTVGPTFTMREWAGLWPTGHVRYTLGARVLAFVNGKSAAGFSSPVHGAEGLVPVVVQGANAQPLLDVRRVAASVVRTPGTALPMEANGAVALSDALGWIDAPGSGSGSGRGRGLMPVPTRGRKPVLEQGIAPVEPVAAPVEAPSEPGRAPVKEPRAPRALPIQQEVSHDLR